MLIYPTLKLSPLQGMAGMGGGVVSRSTMGAGGGDNVYSFYGLFNGSGASSTPAQAYVQWLTNFENSYNVTQMTMTFSSAGGSASSPTYTITDTGYINGLRSALAAGNDYGTGATDNWALGWNCGSGTGGYNFTRGGKDTPTFIIGYTESCQCDYTQIRPLLDNGNWGGWGGGCNQPSQYMGMSFTGFV